MTPCVGMKLELKDCSTKVFAGSDTRGEVVAVDGEKVQVWLQEPRRTCWFAVHHRRLVGLGRDFLLAYEWSVLP